jgi:hypothetical protein
MHSLIESLRSFGRELKRRPFLIWLLGIVLLITALVVHGYMQESSHLEHWPTYMWFGITSVLGLFMSIWIKATIQPMPFDNSRELLIRFKEVFDDAAANGDHISVLYLCPNPGQFDFQFKLHKDFGSLEKSILAALSSHRVKEIRWAMLGDFPVGDKPALHGDLQLFVEKFYKGEETQLTTEEQQRGGGLAGYQSNVLDYFSRIGKALQRSHKLKFSSIGGVVLDRMLKGERILILAAAARKAFLGSVYFDAADRYRFEALDVVAPQTIHDLYNALLGSYSAADNGAASRKE